MSSNESTPVERRNFIKLGAVGTIGAGVALHTRTASAQVRGANDRVRVGVIGTGRQGIANMKNTMQQPNTEIVAVCDVYTPNLDQAAALATGAEKYGDFRRVLDRKDVDAVIIGTPDHWHAYQMIAACQAGKDVYVEKPISLTIQEGRKMVDAAKRYNRVVQVGTQQRSGKHFAKAVELVRSGKLGKITAVRAWNFGNEAPEGIGNPPNSAPPANLDWEMWLGPAPKVPFNANRFGVHPTRYSNFRWFWDYAGGMMTDWGVHWLDIVQWAMNVDAPQSVSAVGGKFCLQDNRETPDTITATYIYPGFICTYENRACNGQPINGKGGGILFHGSDGTLFVDRQGFEVTPEMRRISKDEAVPRTEPVEVKNSNQHHLDHTKNFIDCVRSRATPICDIEAGHRSTSVALLGNVAYRSGQHIKWDGRREQIEGNDREASRYLTTAHRKPWELKV